MQARAGALDELLQSGVLEDVGGDTDDIQQELDEAGSAAQVDRELAAMKAQLAISPAGTRADLRQHAGERARHRQLTGKDGLGVPGGGLLPAGTAARTTAAAAAGRIVKTRGE